MFNYPRKDERFLTVEKIYEKTTEAEIFRHYLGKDFKIGQFYNSPLRSDDDTPSFNIYINSQGKLRYKDWGHSQGTCLDFVKEMFHCDFITACRKVNADMNLGLISSQKMTGSGLKVEYKEYRELSTSVTQVMSRCRLRNWKQYDADFWKQFKISSTTLKKFGIYPGKELWMRKEGQSWQNLWINTEDNPIYIFKLKQYILQDNEISFHNQGIKGYRPYQIDRYGRDPRWKWFNGVVGNYVQGLEQLPSTGDILFITSSMKDVATLYEIGIPAIAPNSEGSHLNKDLIDHLKTRFKRIYVNYDNDAPGVKASQDFTKLHELGYWNIPTVYHTKDVSDFVKRYGQEKLIALIEEKIKL